MLDEKMPKTKETTKLSHSNKKLREQQKKEKDQALTAKSMLSAQIPYYNQLSPLWQDFYYQVISKVDTTNKNK